MPYPERARAGYADRVLWLLRIYGPCSIAELRRHLGNEGYVYSAVYKHRTEGHAVRLGEASYAITEAGIRHLVALKGKVIDERNAQEARDHLPLFD